MKRSLSIVLAAFSLAFLPFAQTQAHSYSLLQISPVPGLGFPFGDSDAFVSAGPIGTISGRVDFLQAAGVFNIASDLRGIQAAGVFNIADEMSGIQLGGVFNIAGGTRSPVQVAGVFNIADDLQGIQVSGTFNIADQVQGLQIAPVFNIADDVKGAQVGLVNVADRVSGVQIGLVNISSNGVFGTSLDWTADTGHLRASLETGNTSMYAVYALSMPRDEWFQSTEHAVVSAGLGTRIGDRHGLAVDIKASASQLVGGDTARFADAMCWTNGLTPADVLAPWPTLDAGLSLNLGPCRIIGGLRANILLASAPNLPADLRRGFEYSDTWFGEPWSAWTTWYMGVGF